jgi:hypothetical protein
MLRIRRSKTADFTALGQEVQKVFSRIAQNTLEIAKQNTPIRSGRARESWTQKPTRSGFEVQNSVPYIEQLEKGRSKQAPQGIIGPTTRAVNRKITQTSRLQSGRLSR